MLIKEFLNNDDMIDLINYSSDLIALIDKEGKISFINHAWKRSLSYEKDDLCHRNLSDILNIRDGLSIEELLRRGEPDENSFFFTAQLKGKKGTSYQVDGTVKKTEHPSRDLSSYLILLKVIGRHNIQKEKQLLKIIELGKKLNTREGMEIDYQIISDEMMELSGGKYVFINILDDQEKSYTSIALSGAEEDIEKAEKMLGNTIKDRKWIMDADKEALREQNITVFPSLSALSMGQIPKSKLSMVEAEFQTGEVIIAKIMNDQSYIGDFTIVMEKGASFQAHEVVEIYAAQIGLFIDKKRVLNKLKDNTDKFDFAMETAGVGAWEWDLLKDNLTFSSRWYTMLGYNSNEFSGDFHSWKKIWHPDESEMNANVLEQFMSGMNEKLELIHRMKHKNGQWKWIMTRGYSFRNSEGIPYLLVGFNVDISKSQEEKNRNMAEREKFANIIEATNAGTWEWNVQTGENKYNSRWAEIVGYSLDELSPINEDTWISLVHPDDLKKSNEEIESLFFRKKEYYSLPCRMKHKDGHWVWVLDKGKVINWTEDGKPLYMFGTHIDITESKMLEMEIKESEDNYRFLVESSYDIVYRIGTDGKFIFVSKAFENILGHTTAEAIGRALTLFVHPDDVPKIHDFFRRINESGQRRETTDYRLLHKNGTYRWFTTNAIPIFDEDNVITGFTGTARDITEVKAANMALVEQKDELERFFNVNIDFFCISDMMGKFKKVNQAWERNLGYEHSVLVGRNALDFVHPDDIEVIKSSIRRMSYERKEVSFVIRFQRSDGGYRTLEWKAQSSGELIYASARDVTENKNLENNLFIEKELFKTTLLSVGDAVISTDSLGRVTIMNKVAERMTGWSIDVALGRPIEDVFKIYHIETGQPLQNRVREILRKGKSTGYSEMILISNSGREMLIEDSASQIKDNTGSISGVVIVFRDITAKKEREKRIEFMSYHDSLTGLYNRRYIEDAIKRMETTRNLPFTVMVMDVNGLKITNDAFGHQLGDMLLKRTADIIRMACRENDVLSRVGGDEFVLLLPKTSPKEAEAIKKRIEVETSQAYIGPVSISLAIGHATKSKVSQNILEVQKVADNNMYRDKLKTGKITKGRIVQTILGLIDEKFPDEREHLKNVAVYSAEIGRAMGLRESDVERVRTAGRLHDIGKISVPKEILLKPDKLSFEEYEIIRKHAETSYQILKSVEEYAGIAEDVLYHHERIDGMGYPEGLKGNEIPLNSRIIAVADAYEAMIGNRLYQKRKSKEEAIREMRRCAGTQFDEDVVEVFIRQVLLAEGDMANIL